MRLPALRCLKRFRMVSAESRFQMFERGCVLRTSFVELAFSLQRAGENKMSASDERGEKVHPNVRLLQGQCPHCVGARFFDHVQLHPEISPSQKVGLHVVMGRWVCFGKGNGLVRLHQRAQSIASGEQKQ